MSLHTMGPWRKKRSAEDARTAIAKAKGIPA